MHIPRYVLLPAQPEQFRKTSVTDRPGDWGTLYDKVLKTAKIEVLNVPDNQEGYLETNLCPASDGNGEGILRLR